MVDKEMVDMLRNMIEPFGIGILALGTSGMDLPDRLNRALAIESQAEKNKAAKLISAKANLNTASQVKQTAEAVSYTHLTLPTKA